MSNSNKLFYQRSPIVAILGHVDHGKTTLLDYIRKSHIAKNEYASITQKIGAYEITTEFKGYKTNKITFIDTPGHEAFTQLRMRGAKVADIALLIIDGKDSVMPQTIESISHIKEAGIPFIVVINKIDLPEANPDKVKNDLLKHKIVVEDKGGKIPSINISAKTGQGINDLLEMILLVSSDLNLTYNPQNPLEAIVIENKKDKRGIVVSAIVKDGFICIGQTVYTEDGNYRVRQLFNDLGKSIEKAFPSTPLEILGIEKFPLVGSKITGFPQKTFSQKTKDEIKSFKKITLADLSGVDEKKEKELKIILKTDNYGSQEAILAALKDNQNIKVILSSIGDIHRSDVFLAKTSQSIIIGFNVEVDKEVKELAKQEKILIKTYKTIFDILEELEEVSYLLKEKEKEIKGEAKILANFIINNEKIFGIKVTKGKICLGNEVEVFRGENPIGKSKIISLQIRAKKVKELKKGEEAGIILQPTLDIQIGDVIKYIL